MRPNPNPEHNQDTTLLIQREVGKALRLSFDAVTREPLSEQIVLLLLRLALSEALRASVEEETDQATVIEASRRVSVSL
jgi:hypothetical protein